MAHLHEMRDSDNHFIIDPTTMVITNNSAKHTLQQGDHNSEVYTFEIPRFLCDGHDLLLCNSVQIHYINIKGDKTEQSKDVHKVTDMAVSEEDPETAVFTWTVHGNATKYAGSLNFRIHFYCIDESGNYTYKKHTEIFKGITISEGFDNAEAVEEDHSDILAEWETRLDAVENMGIVLYTEQELIDEQKAQARANIGAKAETQSDFLVVKVNVDATTIQSSHTFAQIKEWLTSGKGAYAIIDNNVYQLSCFTDNIITFSIYVFSHTVALMWELLFDAKGHITHTAKESNLVSYSEQYLINEEKAQARENIGAASKDDVDSLVGDIETALDSIISIQNELMGVTAE